MNELIVSQSRLRDYPASLTVICLQNGTQELLLPRELYCVMGCNDAVNLYFQRLKGNSGRDLGGE